MNGLITPSDSDDSSCDQTCDNAEVCVSGYSTFLVSGTMGGAPITLESKQNWFKGCMTNAMADDFCEITKAGLEADSDVTNVEVSNLNSK